MAPTSSGCSDTAGRPALLPRRCRQTTEEVSCTLNDVTVASALAGIAIPFLATRCCKIVHAGSLITSFSVLRWSSLLPVGVAACYYTTVRSGTASLRVLPARKNEKRKKKLCVLNCQFLQFHDFRQDDGSLTLSSSTSASMRSAFFWQLLLFSSSSSLR